MCGRYESNMLSNLTSMLGVEFFLRDQQLLTDGSGLVIVNDINNSYILRV